MFLDFSPKAEKVYYRRGTSCFNNLFLEMAFLKNITKRQRAVLKDLTYLSKKWGPDADGEDIYQTASILRRLLVEGYLAQVWNSLFPSQRLKIKASVISERDKNSPLPHVWSEMAYLKTSKENAAHIACVSLKDTDKISPPDLIEFMKQTPSENLPTEKYMDLEEFKKSYCIYFPQKSIGVSNTGFIKYICNIQGSVHSGNARPDEKWFCDLLDSIYDPIYGEDETFLGETNITEKYSPVLAIGQRVANSDDVKLLHSKLESLF